MTTLELIDKRLRYALVCINTERVKANKEAGLRFDLDQPLSGYLRLNDRFIYHVRDGMRFTPLMTIEISCRQNVYYFDVKGIEGTKGVYDVLKNPPRRTRTNSETFWLATELDTPLDAIEGFMKEKLA